MKKKMTWILTAAMIFGLCILGGCGGGNKTALAGSSFKEKMEAAGYTVTQITNEAVLGNDLTEYYTATNSNHSTSIRFMVAKDADSAKKHFDDDQKGYDSYKPSDTKDESGGNYNLYTASVDSQYTYVYLLRVDNTYLSAITDKNMKDDLSKTLSSLGY